MPRMKPMYSVYCLPIMDLLSAGGASSSSYMPRIEPMYSVFCLPIKDLLSVGTPSLSSSYHHTCRGWIQCTLSCRCCPREPYHPSVPYSSSTCPAFPVCQPGRPPPRHWEASAQDPPSRYRPTPLLLCPFSPRLHPSLPSLYFPSPTCEWTRPDALPASALSACNSLPSSSLDVATHRSRTRPRAWDHDRTFLFLSSRGH
mmetsp:Transcript_3820/g.9753  ORF Transcript_3820/g.9753 Transcript_3820/m.9753 type:complete len:200 (+) Transcript_3820:247-846(+)